MTILVVVLVMMKCDDGEQIVENQHVSLCRLKETPKLHNQTIKQSSYMLYNSTWVKVPKQKQHICCTKNITKCPMQLPEPRRVVVEGFAHTSLRWSPGARRPVLRKLWWSQRCHWWLMLLLGCELNYPVFRRSWYPRKQNEDSWPWFRNCLLMSQNHIRCVPAHVTECNMLYCKFACTSSHKHKCNISISTKYCETMRRGFPRHICISIHVNAKRLYQTKAVFSLAQCLVQVSTPST